MKRIISTGLGDFSTKKFRALITVRSIALRAIKEVLQEEEFKEVTTSSLVNIAGSCENPYASFSLNYYGREAHLSQSAQLQLEALVVRLEEAVFTVNNSFREEHFDDPETDGRRLSEFTLIEPERPFPALSPEAALDELIAFEEWLVKKVVREVLAEAQKELLLLGADMAYLEKLSDMTFARISYDDALEVLNEVKVKDREYVFGDDLGIVEERALMKHFDDAPVFVTHFPASLKFFNMMKVGDGERVFGVDLLLPRLGETIGGAIREVDGEKIKKYLLASDVAEYIRKEGGDPLEPFSEYFKMFEEGDVVLRGGFGIGFERFIGFLLNSNDILETVAYRAMQP